jgi:hypothetical protein
MAWPVDSAGLGLPSAASGPPQNSTARLPTPATAGPALALLSVARIALRVELGGREASGTLSERTCFVAETGCSSLPRSTPADACYPRGDSHQRRPITRRRPRRAIASRVDPGAPYQRDPLLRPADLTTSLSKPARQIQTKSRGAAAQARRIKGPRDGADGSIVSRTPQFFGDPSASQSTSDACSDARSPAIHEFVIKRLSVRFRRRASGNSCKVEGR